MCPKRNVKSLYNCINKYIGHSKYQIFIKSTNDNKVMNDHDSANTFAEFFQSTYSKENGFLPVFPMVKNTILDHIPNVFLKKLSGSLSVPLALLFQKSLKISKIPKVWKYAKVIPIFKGKGSKFDVSNYRPISLTSNICKIMESIVHKYIITLWDKCNLLDSSQHCFRQKILLLNPIY